MKKVRNDTRPFIRFPLPLVREVLLNGAPAIDIIKAYGVFRASQVINVETPNSYRQLWYYAARSPKDVPFTLLEVAEGFNSDLSECFADGKIEPLTLQDFRAYCDSPESGLNVKELLEWYRVIVATTTTYKDVELPSARTILAIEKNHEELANGQVPVSVDMEMLKKFQETMKTEADIVRCAMYLGIRSIMGKGSKVGVTTQAVIMQRSFGCRNRAELDELLKDERLAAAWKKWSTRRKYRELMDSLIVEGLIKQLGYGRRTYVSTSINNDSEFVEAVAARIKRKTIAGQRNEAKKKREEWEKLLDVHL